MSTRDERVTRNDPAGPQPGPARAGAHRLRSETADRDTIVEQDRGGPPGGGPVGPRADVGPARTSAAAASALALGVAAFSLVVTVVLSPIGVLLAVLGLVLGIVGIRATRVPARTGRAVAITGLVFGVVALLLVAAAAIGITAFLDDPAMVERLRQGVDQLSGQAAVLRAPGVGA